MILKAGAWLWKLRCKLLRLNLDFEDNGKTVKTKVGSRKQDMIAKTEVYNFEDTGETLKV